jgi:tetratricopeptide (TPR) repeat protein
MNALRIVAAFAVLAGLALAGWWASRSGDAPPADPEPAPVVEPQPDVAPRRPVEDAQASPGGAANDALREWRELNAEAVACLRRDELERAVELLERCVDAVPDQPVFRSNLAEALARLARSAYEGPAGLEVAVEHLSRALEVDPERVDLEPLLERWKRELEVAAGHFSELGQYFEISYDAERLDILNSSQLVIDTLELDYGELRDWFQADPVLDSGERIRVVLYDKRDFRAVTGLGDWAGGAFDGVVRVSVEDLALERARWSATLKHELVHAFLRVVGGRDVPGWLNEGLAQWLEPDRRLDAARRELAGAELFGLETLKGSLASWSDAAAVRRAYAQSRLFVDHIARHYGEEALRRMVAACAAGETPEAAFEAWARIPLATALADLAAELDG